eukprot:6162764-Pyramimonas_sp.AAC.2
MSSWAEDIVQGIFEEGVNTSTLVLLNTILALLFLPILVLLYLTWKAGFAFEHLLSKLPSHSSVALAVLVSSRSLEKRFCAPVMQCTWLPCVYWAHQCRFVYQVGLNKGESPGENDQPKNESTSVNENHAKSN